VVHPFRRAIEARDLDAAMALMRDDVVFRSPAVFTPYHGRDALRRILEAVLAVFEDFRYVREIGADIGVGARDHALVFEARVRDKQIEGATSSSSMTTAQSVRSRSWCARCRACSRSPRP
jgi:ketosteroid isomerase-like protein